MIKIGIIGGTALAACRLLTKLGAEIRECCFVINLPDLGGNKKRAAAGFKAFMLLDFVGE